MIMLSTFSNGMIALAYFWLTASIHRFYVAKRKILPYAWMLLLFEGFIFACGCAHLTDVLAFHWPAYRFFLVIDSATAALSIATAILTPATVDALSRFQPPEEVEILKERAAHLEIQKQRALVIIRGRRDERKRSHD